MSSIQGFPGMNAYAQGFENVRQTRKPPEIADLFKKMDVNADGGVSVEEFAAQAPKGRAPERTAAEEGVDRAAMMQKIFAQIDADGDGKLTETEMTDHARRRGMGGPPPNEGAQGASGTKDLASSLLDSLDTDGDGKVSLEELTAALEKKAGASGVQGAASQPNGIEALLRGLREKKPDLASILAQNGSASGADPASVFGQTNGASVVSFRVQLAISAYNSTAKTIG